MKTKTYTIYDSKTGLYNKPMYFHNHPAAIRAVTQALTDEQSTLGQHPEDYSLFYIGEYDEETAKMEQEPTHTHLANLHELVQTA